MVCVSYTAYQIRGTNHTSIAKNKVYAQYIIVLHCSDYFSSYVWYSTCNLNEII